jgi:hypothetical protein
MLYSKSVKFDQNLCVIYFTDSQAHVRQHRVVHVLPPFCKYFFCMSSSWLWFPFNCFLRGPFSFANSSFSTHRRHPAPSEGTLHLSVLTTTEILLAYRYTSLLKVLFSEGFLYFVSIDNVFAKPRDNSWTSIFHPRSLCSGEFK